MKYANNGWATKHKIYIFDNRWGKLGSLLCLPIMWLENRYLRPKLSQTTFIVILALTVIVLSSVFAQIVGGWSYKRQIKQLRSKGYDA